MDAHRVEVLDRAHDDDVVVQIADHLELELVPATDGLLDEHLCYRALAQAPLDDCAQLRVGLCEPAPMAAEGEGRTDDRRGGDHSQLVDRGDDLRARCAQPTALDRVAEQGSVLGAPDHVDPRTEQLDPQLLQYAGFRELDREVERGLATECRQDRVGPLPSEDVCDALDVERLDVGAIGEPGVGHDRGRVRVDDDRAEPVLTQDLERLAAGVVELAGLADHDRARSDQADGRDVCAPRHQAGTRLSTQPSRIGQASCVPGPASGWNCTERALSSG